MAGRGPGITSITNFPIQVRGSRTEDEDGVLTKSDVMMISDGKGHTHKHTHTHTHRYPSQ